MKQRGPFLFSFRELLFILQKLCFSLATCVGFFLLNSKNIVHTKTWFRCSLWNKIVFPLYIFFGVKNIKQHVSVITGEWKIKQKQDFLLAFLFPLFHVSTFFMEFKYQDDKNHRTPIPILHQLSAIAYMNLDISGPSLQGNTILHVLFKRPIFFCL